MIVPMPFAYPAEPHQRQHGPGGYRNYRDYKPWLRDEFIFRCVYCLEREMWYPDRTASFSIDHIVPQSVDPVRICDYDNLVYACTRCNAAKQDVDSVLDPTRTALGEHIRSGNDGVIQALTPEGQDMIDLLHLDKAPALAVRKDILDLLALKQEYPQHTRIHQMFVEKFGYPEELPDLSALRPPAGNSRSGSDTLSHHRRRSQGALGKVY